MKLVKHKNLSREWRKKSPKTWAKLDKRWDIKMIGPVMEFTIEHLVANVNPRLRKLAKPGEYIISGPKVEKEVWKLLRQVRRMTLLEKKNK